MRTDGRTGRGRRGGYSSRPRSGRAGRRVEPRQEEVPPAGRGIPGAVEENRRSTDELGGSGTGRDQTTSDQGGRVEP